jgi:ATP-dependent helicase HrpA
VKVSPEAWNAESLPIHLRPRIEIVDARDQPLASGRDMRQLQRTLEKAQAPPPDDSSLWRQMAMRWERFDLSGWTVGDVPDRLTVTEAGAVPVYAWPGLQNEEGRVSLRLFRSRDVARQSSLEGARRLVELAIHKDLAWLVKDLLELRKLGELYAPWGSVDELESTALEHLKRHVLPREVFPSLRQTHFDEAVLEAKERLRGLAMPFVGLIKEILSLRRDLEAGRSGAPVRSAGKVNVLNDLSQLEIQVTEKSKTRRDPGMTPGLDYFLPARFLDAKPFEQLRHVPRFLKAMQIRAERALQNRVKDHDQANPMTF